MPFATRFQDTFVQKTLSTILGLLLLAASPYAMTAPRLSLGSLLGETESDGFHQYLPNEKLDVFGKVETDVINLTLLTRLCAHEVDTLFGDQRQPEHRLNFFAMDISFSESDFKSWDVPLRTADPLEVSVVKILRGLLLRQLRERLGLRKIAPPPSIQFLAAALANRIVHDGKGTTGRYRKDYRIPRRQLATGHCPDLTQLLTEVPPSQSRLLFRIYLVHSDLLLNCLEHEYGRKFPQFLRDWWRLECQEQLGTAEALARVLGIPPKQLQQWYAGQVTTVLVRGGAPGEVSEDVIEQLQKLLTISVMDLGGTETVRSVHLEDLPKLLKNRPPDVSTLGDVQSDLMQLKFSASPIFHEALDQYIAAVDALRQNDVKLFRKRYRLAKKTFEQAVKLQVTASTLLDEAEYALSPVDRLRTAAWDTILEHRKRLRKPMEQLIGLEETN